MVAARRCQLVVTHSPAEVQAQVLEHITHERRRNRQPVVLFDLDGTLFDNGPRTWEILREFARETGRAGLLAKLEAFPRVMLPYTLAETLAEVDETDPVLCQDALAFWKARFFRDEYIRHDEPLAGARSFVQRCWGEGATVVYFSGRDSAGMLLGTAQSLRTHGFPVGLARTVITLKEAFETEDLHFKRESVQFLNTLGSVVASFDNEPGNCNMFAGTWPQAVTVALATSHAPNPVPLAPSVKVTDGFAE
ncbi:MAG: haloacid dehalogenase-like hydrolase [Myxococcota bacterium]